MSEAGLSPAMAQYARRQGIDPARLRAALGWRVLLWSGEASATDARRCREWAAAHPENQRAWEEVERMSRALGEVPADVARHALRRAAPLSRRRALGVLGLVGAGLLLGQGVRESTFWQHATADYHCAVGERRRLRLADGSTALLNTASALDVSFDTGRRQCRVVPGSELMLDTRLASVADQRPFIVTLAATTLALDSAQVVLRDYGHHLDVGVLAGRVTVLAAAPGGAGDTIGAGQRARLSPTGLVTEPLVPSAALAWTRGVLQAQRMRLDAFLRELARYRHGFLYCDEQVASLIISGAYPLDDTDYVLESLVQALPISLHYRTPWRVRVAAA